MSKFNLFNGIDILASDEVTPPDIDLISKHSQPVVDTPVLVDNIDRSTLGNSYRLYVDAGINTEDSVDNRYSLGVSGPSVFNGSVAVNGPSNLNGAVAINGGLNINSPITIMGHTLTQEQLRRLIELVS